MNGAEALFAIDKLKDFLSQRFPSAMATSDDPADLAISLLGRLPSEKEAVFLCETTGCMAHAVTRVLVEGSPGPGQPIGRSVWRACLEHAHKWGNEFKAKFYSVTFMPQIPPLPLPAAPAPEPTSPSP